MLLLNQVDLEEKREVFAIATQGYRSSTYYTLTYNLQYSTDGNTFKYVTDNTGHQVNIKRDGIFLQNRYKITTVLKVERDMVTGIAASLIRRYVILVIMHVQNSKADVIVLSETSCVSRHTE